MKKTAYKFLALLLTLVLLGGLLPMGAWGVGLTVNPPYLALTSGSGQLIRYNYNSGVVGSESWTSFDSSVASVSQSGYVTGNGVGYTKIRVTISSGSGSSGESAWGTCGVTVPGIRFQNVYYNTSSTLTVGHTMMLTARAYFYYDGTSSSSNTQNIIWASGDSSIATVARGSDSYMNSDDYGRYTENTCTITAVAEGETKITASAGNGTITYTVKVIPVKHVESVTVSPEKLTLVVGSVPRRLSAVVAPSDAADTSVTWSSSDASIVEVDDYGYVTPKAVGTATVTATAKDTTKGNIFSTCEITVTPAVNRIELHRDSALGDNVTGSEIRLTAAEDLPSATLWAEVLPDSTYDIGIKDTSVTWTPSQNDIISITPDESDSRKAVVKVIYTGTGSEAKSVTVTATSVENPSVKQTCTVIVTPRVAVTGVTIHYGDEDATGKSLKEDFGVELETNLEGHTTLELTAVVDPDSAYNKNVTWSTSNESIATVDQNGVVTAVYTRTGYEEEEKGPTATAEITATTEDGGKTASCTVTVKAPPLLVENVELNPTTITIDPGATFAELAARVTAPNAADRTLIWTSSNPAVATVASASQDTHTAAVTGVAIGTATITATAKAGGKSASCTVIVSGIELTPATLDLIIEEDRTVSIDPNRTFGNAGSVNNWTADVTEPGVVAVTRSEDGWIVSGETVGSTTVTVSGSYGGSPYTAKCVVTVRPNTLTYRLNERNVLDFTDDVSDDVFAFCGRITGTAAYITNLSVPTEEGTIYFNYDAEADPGAGIGGLERYYFRAADGSLFSGVTYVPRPGFTGTATISYTGYGADGTSYNSKIYVLVEPAEIQLTYVTRAGEPVCFQAEDFSEYCQTLNGRAIRYATFTLPAADTGKLQYNLITDGLYENAVSTGTMYYRTGSPNLDDVWFVPAAGYAGSFSLPFTYADTAGNSFSGRVRIIVTGEAAETDLVLVTYGVSSGARVYFDADDFSAACYRVTGRALSYVTLGSTGSTYYGTLYYGGSTLNTTSYAYYREAAASRREIDSLYYAAASNRSGSFTIPFTGTDIGGASFDGVIRITVTAPGAALTYTVAPGEEVFFDISDFSSASYSATNRELNYIRLEALPPAGVGTMYDGHGVVTETYINYFRTVSGARRLISDLSFAAPKDFTGSITLPYRGYNTNGSSFVGSVTIRALISDTVEEPDGNPLLIYETTGPAVTFRAADFLAAAGPKLPYDVASVRFVPQDPDAGTLCMDYVSPTSYTPLDGSVDVPIASVSNVSYQPKAGVAGDIYLTYSAKDITGKNVSGTVTVRVTPPAESAWFRDMEDYGWAVPAVDFLYINGLISGTSVVSRTYSPALQTRRGDYVLILSRGFQFPDAGVESFDDIYTAGYYAAAIAAAKSIGVVSGDDQGMFRPLEGVTRQDAAVILWRAMSPGGSITYDAEEVLSAFTDAEEIAPYAREAMAWLARRGVFIGDEANRLNPTSVLTRAEMAVVLYRAIT